MSNFGFNFYLSNRLFLELAREYQLCVRYGGKRHMCRQSSFYASYSTLHAHISVFHLTSAQATINICFEWHLACTHLSWDSDICAEDSLSRPYIQYSLHTSHFFNRHLRGQTLIHALSGILHAHMSGLCVTRSFSAMRMTGLTSVTDPSLRLRLRSG